MGKPRNMNHQYPEIFEENICSACFSSGSLMWFASSFYDNDFWNICHQNHRIRKGLLPNLRCGFITATVRAEISDFSGKEWVIVYPPKIVMSHHQE